MSDSSGKSDCPGYRDAPQRVPTRLRSYEDKLFIAISQGDARSVRILLRKGVNVNATHPSGRTPLGTAAHLGNVEILKILLEPLEPSTDLNSKGGFSNTSKKSRSNEREFESWCGGVSPKPISSSASSIDRRMMSDAQCTKLSCRPNSLSSDDETSEETDKGVPHHKIKKINDKIKVEPVEEVNRDIQRNMLLDIQRKFCNRLSSSDKPHQHCSLSPLENEEKMIEERLETNQGYFIVVHNEYSAEEKKTEGELEKYACEENFPEPMTPDGMDKLEWDSELQPEVCNSPEEDRDNSGSWIDLYHWYAEYLAKYCAVGMSVKCTSLRIDVNELDMYRRSAMHYAAEQGNIEVLRILLKAGCLVDVGDSDDVTPLHLAAARDNPESVALLISCGAKVNWKSIDGTGPLHMAAARGFIQTATILLKNGASVNALDRSDRTPLLLAVSRGLRDMVKLLISHGAKVNVEDILGYTPLCQAVWQQEKDIVRVLLAAGAKLTHSDRLLHCAILHRCPDIAELLVTAGSIVNLRDDSGDTPLIIAARSGQADMVKMLLKNGAMASYPNGLTGSTPLHEAVESLRLTQFAALKEILLSLLKHRGPSGLLNMESSSAYDIPLVRALIHDRDHAMILLIQYGADVNILQQHTPIVSEDYLLKRKNRMIIAQLMVSAGLNLWHGTENLRNDAKYSDDSPTSWIASVKFNPMSLSGLSRLKFRLYHGENLYKAVSRSGLPGSLRRYIMLEDIVSADDYVHSRFRLNPKKM